MDLAIFDPGIGFLVRFFFFDQKSSNFDGGKVGNEPKV